MYEDANLVSIRSLDNPEYYLRVQNGFSIVLKKYDLKDINFAKEATFIVREGLVDSTLYSFELLSKPEFFLRQKNDQVIAEQRQDCFKFKDDSSWFMRPALAKVDFLSIDFN